MRYEILIERKDVYGDEYRVGIDPYNLSIETKNEVIVLNVEDIETLIVACNKYLNEMEVSENDK